MGWFDDAVKSVGDVIGGIGPLAADALTGGSYSTQQANAQNVMLNRENRDWQERMSNSAYQRAMDDMRKAGLNPMLAYQQGGASTPSTQAATVEPVKMGAGLANTAKTAMELMSDQNNKKADTILKAESAETQKSTQELNKTLALKATANARESYQNATRNFAETQKTIAQTRGEHAKSDEASMDAQLRKQRFEMDKKAQKFDAILDRVSNSVGAINSAKKIFSIPIDVNTNKTNSYDPKKDVRDTLRNFPKGKK